MRESGVGWREIAKELKVSVGTLYNALLRHIELARQAEGGFAAQVAK
jgi:hypothetical protein